jgi:hypothetical protein
MRPELKKVSPEHTPAKANVEPTDRSTNPAISNTAATTATMKVGPFWVSTARRLPPVRKDLVAREKYTMRPRVAAGINQLMP